MSSLNSLPPSEADKRHREPSMEEILASIRRIIADDQSLPRRDPPLSEAEVSRPEMRRSPAPPEEPSASEPPVATTSYVPEPYAHEPYAPEPAFAPAPASVSSPPAADMTAPSRHTDPFEVPPRADAPRMSAQAYGSIAAPQFATPDNPPEYREEAPKSRSPAPVPPVDDDRGPAVEAPLHHAVEDDEPEYDEPLYDQPLGNPAPAGHGSLFSAATDSSVSSAFNMLAASRLADNSEEIMTLVRDMIRPLLRTWLDDNLPSMVERLVRAEIERVARGGR